MPSPSCTKLTSTGSSQRARCASAPSDVLTHTCAHTHASIPLHAQVRPACISYGQWRRYTVQATGPDAANLFARLSARVSYLLVREHAPPTVGTFDVAAGHAAAVAIGNGHSDGLGNGGSTAVSASSAEPFEARTWHVAVHLAARAEAEALGLLPTRFILDSRLMASRKAVGQTIAPLSTGGEGFICCGALAHYMVGITREIRPHTTHPMLVVTTSSCPG